MSKKILVVDDDPVVGILVNEYLSAHGFDIEVLTNGTDCLERLRQELPDILILDLIMPDMTGVQVLQNIRSDSATKALPVILMSADSHSDSLVGQYECTADCYVEKPFDVRRILEAIRSLGA